MNAHSRRERILYWLNVDRSNVCYKATRLTMKQTGLEYKVD